LKKRERQRRALSSKEKGTLKNSRGNDVAKTISVRHQPRFVHRAFAIVFGVDDDGDRSSGFFREQKFAPSRLRGTGKQ
jgi:hypothetical protein